MTRPQCDKKIGYCPSWKGFKPFGGKHAGTGIVEITKAEVESLRLKNIEELDQTKAAEEMGISQSTFQRLLASSYKKVSEALVEGKELVIVEDK